MLLGEVFIICGPYNLAWFHVPVAGFTSMHMMTELNGLRGFKREHMKLETKYGGGNMGKVEGAGID